MTKLSRRKFIAHSILGMSCIISRTALANVLSRPVVEWPSTNSEGSIQLQTEELKTLLNSGVNVVVKPGEHAIRGPIVCKSDFVGISGMSEAKIIFVDADIGGLRFEACESVDVSNLTLEWPGAGLPSRSHYGAGVMFVRTKNARVTNVKVSRAPGAGVHFDECFGSKASSLVIRTTGADGLHFANCSDSQAYDIDCQDTGDDGIAFVDYEKKPKGERFILENAKVVNSRARGIAIVGASKGVATNFFIENCASNGLHIEQDAHYKTRYPSDIIIRQGVVRGAGNVTPLKGNQFGVNILRAANVELNRVQVQTSLATGVSVNNSQNVHFSESSCSNSGGIGVRVFDSSISFSSMNISLAGAELFVGQECQDIVCTNLAINYTNLKAGKVALLLENNQYINLSGLKFSGPQAGYKHKLLVLSGNQAGKLIGAGLEKGSISNLSPLVFLSISHRI